MIIITDGETSRCGVREKTYTYTEAAIVKSHGAANRELTQRNLINNNWKSTGGRTADA